MTIRITKAHLEAKLERISQLGGYASGSYPTPGQLVLDHNGYGYGMGMVCNAAGGQTRLISGATAKELSTFMDGMLAGLDAERSKAHWLGN